MKRIKCKLLRFTISSMEDLFLALT
jgi:hypothetical protein